MTLILSQPYPASAGFLMACLETNPGVYAGDPNMLGMAVHRDVQFTENPNIFFPDQLINTLAHNKDHALGLDTFDFRWTKEFYEEMDPMFLGMALVANPAISDSTRYTIGSAESYKAGTAFGGASGSMGPTTQPTKGQKLVITLTTVSAGIIAGAALFIGGLDANGAYISERIISPTYTQTAGTAAIFVTRQGFYKIIAFNLTSPGISWLGMPVDATIAIDSQTPNTRVYSTGLGKPVLQTASFVHFDGGYTREYVYACMATLGFAGALQGAVTMDASGYCNPLNSLNDPSPTTLGTAAGTNGNPDISPVDGSGNATGLSAVTYVQPVTDQPEMAWRAAIYIDEPGSGMGGTQYGDVESWRWSIATGQARLNTAINSRLYGKINRGKRLHTGEFTVDFATRAEWQRARAATRRNIQIVLYGDAITNTIYRQVTIRLPFTYTAFPISGSSDNTQLQLTGQSEYDAVLGYDCQVSVINTVTSSGSGDAYAAAAHA